MILRCIYIWFLLFNLKPEQLTATTFCQNSALSSMLSSYPRHLTNASNITSSAENAAHIQWCIYAQLRQANAYNGLYARQPASCYKSTASGPAYVACIRAIISSQVSVLCPPIQSSCVCQPAWCSVATSVKYRVTHWCKSYTGTAK